MENLSRAIKKLKPTAEFSFSNNDYSTIKWDKLEGKVPTQDEINKAILQINESDLVEADIRSATREALLQRLGITADEAALLLG
jgi:hypothetical protein